MGPIEPIIEKFATSLTMVRTFTPIMGGGRASSSRGGPQLNRTRVRQSYRGSYKRIQRIKWREHTPPFVVALMAVLSAIVLAVVAWLMIVSR
jgi:hypothetical protein